MNCNWNADKGDESNSYNPFDPQRVHRLKAMKQAGRLRSSPMSLPGEPVVPLRLHASYSKVHKQNKPRLCSRVKILAKR